MKKKLYTATSPLYFKYSAPLLGQTRLPVTLHSAWNLLAYPNIFFLLPLNSRKAKAVTLAENRYAQGFWRLPPARAQDRKDGGGRFPKSKKIEKGQMSRMNVEVRHPRHSPSKFGIFPFFGNQTLAGRNTFIFDILEFFASLETRLCLDVTWREGGPK